MLNLLSWSILPIARGTIDTSGRSMRTCCVKAPSAGLVSDLGEDGALLGLAVPFWRARTLRADRTFSLTDTAILCVRLSIGEGLLNNVTERFNGDALNTGTPPQPLAVSVDLSLECN